MSIYNNNIYINESLSPEEQERKEFCKLIYVYLTDFLLDNDIKLNGAKKHTFFTPSTERKFIKNKNNMVEVMFRPIDNITYGGFGNGDSNYGAAYTSIDFLEYAKLGKLSRSGDIKSKVNTYLKNKLKEYKYTATLKEIKNITSKSGIIYVFEIN